ncbi:carbohydrate ABC transporter permease [Herbaspirillum seropedicae]|uniref:ABC-type sugar transport system, permease component protein n=1 Tax=Herbaspirillum seropedicae (strain SmR1) TaxID=757424 RepID=D8IPH9_HERSS|nr:carbohydrate ABC transporter permease [Herbaspirillum seropedicae]ADJ64876.1 ABC-type sugar transport system, permease component protein [Herbaspirillum seropedicae SmR1]AKN66778.1 sugar ABC transporter permease [Herbaspirillum seropedicae]NQE28228.1 sugar ABC transporter permease [Herbaspirillum seropedicae]UMU22770.1 carbohydrate ABC transporter permease [Herbaspirillum seropedicae]
MGRLITRCAVWGVGIVLVLVAVFPLLWALLNSVKTLLDIVTPTPRFLFTPTLENYRQVIGSPEVLVGLTNSAVIVGSAVLLGTFMGVPAAYVIARYHVPGKRDIQFFLLSLRFLPPVAVAIPLIAIWVDLGLYDTRFSMIVTYLLTTLSTITWLSIPVFQRMPREIEEAATLDGYGPYAVFWKIALPNCATTLLGGIIFSFVLVWNELMIALALTSSNSATLPVVASAFTSMGQEVPWGVINASTVLLALPPLIFVGVLSRLLNSMLKGK